MNSSPRLTLDGNRLKVDGEITSENVVGIRKEGERLLAQNAGKELIVDLSDLGAAHSVVLSLLLCWFRRAGANSLNLRLEGVTGRLLSLASLSGLGDHLPGLESSAPHA
ncbi:STAS domain-containing protein [Marinobacter sp. CHS3-4]|uniref:STAS domain-containing protein n=1 Tax=Marinobacter sp. CHS3-4 TaxID=3045174 RepID=UPI0024B5C00E|nr:STAS domain-containing protein [Marinobacter sp. CHS3-4]MDI9244938.1 STAS domain-containing protein [Marinobacter sp. CHS3-4]